MDATTEYNTDKKGVVILGIVLLSLGIVMNIVFIISWYITKVDMFFNGSAALLLGFSFILFATGLIINEIAKKTKFANRKLLITSEILTWALLLIILFVFILIYICK